MAHKSMCLKILFAFAMLFSSLAHAQTTYGFRIGLNLGTLSGDLGSEPTTSAGLVAGSFVHYALQHDLGAQFEVLYSQKGARFEATTIEGESLERTLQVTYLEVPFLVTYSPSWRSVLRPSLYAGGAIGFEISERIRERLGTFEQSQESDNLTSPDLGAVVGVDLLLPLGLLDALLGLRYTHGFRNLVNAEVRGESELFSRTFAATIGFLF